MGYQSLPWQNGDSQSFEKLVRLYLPALKGKSFLDVGCNTGFFCGWANFQGAAHVKGIDRKAEFIEQAKAWFPRCSFTCSDWNNLGPERFDVVLCLSALHYAEDQQKLIDDLMSKVSPDGLLVLEIGVAPGNEDEFKAVQRSIDTRFFPTYAKVQSLLKNYVHKHIAHSVPQAGDPLPRVVLHVQHRKPLALLLMDGHYAGKSTVVSNALRPDIRCIKGDNLYSEIRHHTLEVSDELRTAVLTGLQHDFLDCSAATAALCDAGLLPQLAQLVTRQAEGQSFSFDHFIPAPYQEALCALFHDAGYFVVNIALWSGCQEEWTRQRVPLKRYQAYMQHLEKFGLIDADAYLEANPDVARAVAEGRMPNAQYHYCHFGHREGRKLKKD